MLSLFRFGYKLCRDVVIMEVSHYLWTTTMNTTLVWKESLLAIVFKKLLNIIILMTSLWCHICPLYCIWHGKDCYIYVSSSVPPDFCLWLLRLHLGCGYWRNRRKKKKKKGFWVSSISALHFPAAAWDVLNILLTLHMAHVQQFWSRKYQTEMWESLLFEIQMLAGRWCPWEFAGSGCFCTSKAKRPLLPHITHSLSACKAGAFLPIFSNYSIKPPSPSHLCSPNASLALQLKWKAHKICSTLINAKNSTFNYWLMQTPSLSNAD